MSKNIFSLDSAVESWIMHKIKNWKDEYLISYKVILDFLHIGQFLWKSILAEQKNEKYTF